MSSEPVDTLPIEPLREAPDATVTIPGSKSLTNRALVCAALAGGRSVLSGVLFADDTEAMIAALRDLGVGLVVDRSSQRIEVTGVGGATRVDGAVLDARLSGTTARFIAPMAALGQASVLLDGAEPLRGRPMEDLFGALEQLGAGVEPLGVPGHLPVRITAADCTGEPSPWPAMSAASTCRACC